MTVSVLFIMSVLTLGVALFFGVAFFFSVALLVSVLSFSVALFSVALFVGVLTLVHFINIESCDPSCGSQSEGKVVIATAIHNEKARLRNSKLVSC
jgi:hypothetical protein